METNPAPAEQPMQPVHHMLRQLRQARGRTLRDVAEHTALSVSTLSRLERGEKAPDRPTLTTLTAVYQLSDWEEFTLTIAAGFQPEPAMQQVVYPRNLHALIETTLLSLPSPGCILDREGFVKAWNHEFEAIRKLSALPLRPIHMLDSLFLGEVPQQLGDAWAHYAARVIQFFHQRTYHLAGEQRFQEVICKLMWRYGAPFSHLWNKLQTGGDALTPLDISSHAILHHTHHGTIKFMPMRSVVHLHYDYDLLTLVPADAQNQEQYRRYKATLGQPEVHFG